MMDSPLVGGDASSVVRHITPEERKQRQLSDETVSWCADVLRRAGVVCITGATVSVNTPGICAGEESESLGDQDHDKVTEQTLAELLEMWDTLHPHIETFQRSWEGVVWETIGRNCFTEVAPRGRTSNTKAGRLSSVH
jgi:hypothetical protein